MSRKTIIFGNGLGMALDPQFFSLDSAIGHVWDGNILDEETKCLVRHCLVDDGDTERPHGEDDLDKLQLVMSACDFLSRAGEGDTHWLSEHGRRFPEAIRQFLYGTALYFHNGDFSLPSGFTAPLAKFLLQTKSHVATLNYDALLYQPMIEAGVLQGYSGALVDGFHSTGFSSGNLERLPGRNFGYYMHLHGSPLFVDRGGAVMKLRQADLGEVDDVVGSHIVLTHVKHKQAVISASALLSSYWEYLGKALEESAGIVIVGYSGCDKHLNTLLRSARHLPIKVVEWNGAGGAVERSDFWRNLIGREVDMARVSSIIEFSDWD